MTRYILPRRCTYTYTAILLLVGMGIMIFHGTVAAFAALPRTATDRVAVSITPPRSVMAASFSSIEESGVGPSTSIDADADSNSDVTLKIESTSVDRRSVLLRATAALLTTSTGAAVVSPSPAQALKPKNEALCGTGFFEHIYEYKCTAIGDIEDEGTSKKMSQAESLQTDGLMGKLGMDFDFGDDDSAKTKPKKTKSPNEAGAKTSAQ